MSQPRGVENPTAAVAGQHVLDLSHAVELRTIERLLVRRLDDRGQSPVICRAIDLEFQTVGKGRWETRCLGKLDKAVQIGDETPLPQHVLIRPRRRSNKVLRHADPLGGEKLDEPIEDLRGGGRRFAGDESRRPDGGRLARQDLRKPDADHPLSLDIRPQRPSSDVFATAILRQHRGDLPLPIRFRQLADDQGQCGRCSAGRVARCAAVRSDVRSWNAETPRGAFACAPIGDHVDAAGELLRAGCAKKPCLAATNVQVGAARIVCLCRLARVAIQPARQIDRQHGLSRRVDLVDHGVQRRAGFAAGACPQQGVDDKIRPRPIAPLAVPHRAGRRECRSARPPCRGFEN